MKLKIAEGADPNYLATVVKIPTINNHPNADRLQLVEIFGNTIIIGKGSYTEDEKVVYFPVESAISTKFLSWANLLDKPELNADQKTKGFFQSKGRVRAVALRGIPSQGFLFKTSELAKYYEIDENTFSVGDTFDTVGDDPLVTKYIKGNSRGSGEQNVKKSRVPKWIESTIGVLPRPIRRNAYLFVNAWYNRNSEGIKSSIVEGQFAFHYKTEHLGKNIWLVKPEDELTITAKVHGTSAIYGNLLVKKPFNPLRNVYNWLGGKRPTTEYKLVYSSRSVLKNRRDGKYTDDVWGYHAKWLEDIIPEGITLYGEIVGWTETGRCIQKNYDYGLHKGHSEFWVYRITETDKDGNTKEYNWNKIDLFCKEYDLKTVPVYQEFELAKDIFPEIPIDEKWPEVFLAKLKHEYLDKTCEFCSTGVVNEGIVVKINTRDAKPVFKFKSPKFVIKESEARDNNEEDMEENS